MYQPPKNLGIVIMIPCFKETCLLSALEAINQCAKPKSGVLIIVLVNEPENADHQVRSVNINTLDALRGYNSNYELICCHQQLPAKKAGVGLARKIGMDEAVRIFERIKKDGVIVCYDADCTCESNYLIEIERTFDEKKVNAGVVFHQHVLHAKNHDEITAYETYLRYYINALRFAGFPHARQTLGSCMVVRSSAYQKQGGMNTRKAGEDFYFLNKLIPLGGFVEINATTVFPSDRVSDRVPFGTGRSIKGMIENKCDYTVYHPTIFKDLKSFFSQVSKIWENRALSLPASVLSYFENDCRDEFLAIKGQTASFNAFMKRFFCFFDAFKILKYVHHARDHYYPNVRLATAMQWLEDSFIGTLSDDPVERLMQLRTFDRQYVKEGQTNS